MLSSCSPFTFSRDALGHYFEILPRDPSHSYYTVASSTIPIQTAHSTPAKNNIVASAHFAVSSPRQPGNTASTASAGQMALISIPLFHVIVLNLSTILMNYISMLAFNAASCFWNYFAPASWRTMLHMSYYP